jgi:hypothetical protein
VEPAGSAEDLHRAWPDLVRLPAGAGSGVEVVYARSSRSAHLLGASLLRVLVACEGFATLDQHAARIAAGEGRPPREVRAELAELAREGLLLSAGEAVQRATAGGADAGPTRIAVLGIPTRDRVPELRAALDSYVGNAVAHGRTPEYMVADDAVTAAGRAETRAAVAAVAARHGVEIAYAGIEEKIRYARALAAHAGVPLPIVELALLNDTEGCSFSLGANQNVLMLHGAGDPMVSVDDDTRCRLAPAPGQLPGLSLASTHDPTALWFPRPGAPDLPDRVVVERDYLALHEALLGRRVTACAVDARRDGLDLGTTSGTFFRRIEANGGRVVCTQMGAAGDSGTGSMWHYLLLDDPARARLLGSEAGYRHAFTRRRVVRVVPRATISDGPFVMSMSFGTDGTLPLPPFFPVQRNADGLFGVVLRATWYDGFFGFIPWVIEHVPAAPRVSSFPDFFASLGKAGCNDLACLLVGASRIEPDRAGPIAGMRSLGAVFERWGRLPLPDFEEIVRMQVLRARSLDLVALEEALARHGRAPAFWARDAERAAEALRKALAQPSLGYPADLVAAFGEAAARPLFARLIRRYGELLQVWPDLFAAAVELRQRGVRPGVAVSP